MMLSRLLLVLLVLVLVGGLTLPALAQDYPVVASGLSNPRHVTYDSDGNLYIAEAGIGGDDTAEGSFGAVKVGQTAQISLVSPDGEQSVLLSGLVSMDSGFGNIVGAHAIHITDDSYWVVLGEGPQELPFEGGIVDALVQIDRETLEVVRVADIYDFEASENPDGAIINSNPVDLAVSEDGVVYVANAGCNCVVSWTIEDGLQLFAAWPQETDNPVPTSVAIDSAGDIYIGFLSGFPFPPQGSRIERYNAAGELLETFTGLTLVTDVLVTDDGALYAVELASGFGDAGYIPDSGRVVRVTADGVTPLLEGLNFPYGMTMDAEGYFLLTVDSAFGAPGSGSVIRVDLGG